MLRSALMGRSPFGAGSTPGAAIAGRGRGAPNLPAQEEPMTRFSVLLSAAALVVALAAMSAGGSGVKDMVDPDLTAEVEGLVARSVLREYAGLQRTPIPPIPPSDGTPAAPVDVEIPLVIGDGHTPLTDLDTLYGVYGYGLPPAAVPAPALSEPPTDLVDDTPAMIASAWSNPPLDIK